MASSLNLVKDSSALSLVLLPTVAPLSTKHLPADTSFTSVISHHDQNIIPPEHIIVLTRFQYPLPCVPLPEFLPLSKFESHDPMFHDVNSKVLLPSTSQPTNA